MQPAPCFSSYRPLIDNEDLKWFSANETEARDNCPPTTFRRWAEQAAWLTILQAFDEHPTLEELVFDVDESDPDLYVFVQTLHRGDDELNGLGEDPEKLDEYLQSYLNDMGRNASTSFQWRLAAIGAIDSSTSFHWRLAATGVTRSSLEKVGEEVLGGEWESRRREAAMENQLPQTQDRSAPKPRV